VKGADGHVGVVRPPAEGEPFARFGRDGVEVNKRAPSGATTARPAAFRSASAAATWTPVPARLRATIERNNAAMLRREEPPFHSDRRGQA
jgi:hypothetical protein